MGLLVVVLLLVSLLYAQAAPKSSVETYHVDLDVEGETKDLDVDVSGHVVVVSLPTGEEGSEAEGSTLVIDYAKSMTGVYLEETRSCYLIGGVPKSVPSPTEFKQALEARRDGLDTGDQLSYTVADDYPIKDHSLLPAPLQNACAGLSLQWLEPEPSETQAGSLDVPHLQRRACRHFRFWFIVWISWSRGCG